MIKKLPKATAQTFDDLRRLRDDAPPAKAAKAVPRQRRPAAAKAATETRTEPSAQPPIGEAAELRRARAGQIVERYTAYSAVGSVVRIPLVETLSVVLLIV